MRSGRISQAQDLVYTTNYVEATMLVGDVKSWFQSQLSVVSLGVLGEGGRFGLITRNHLNQSLLNHGHSPEFLKQPISDAMISDPLCVEASIPIEELVMQLLADKSGNDEFFQDVVVQEKGHFVGLLSVRDLLVNHLESITHQITAMEAQQNALVQKNKELFASSFKLGQMEGQFKIIFEKVPMPLVLFSDEGKVVAANPRFNELLEYPKQLDAGTAFRKLFEGGFPHLYQHAIACWEQGKNDAEDLYRTLTLRLYDGRPLLIGAFVELMPDGRHILLSVSQLVDDAELAEEMVDEEPEAPQEVIRTVPVKAVPARRAPGKVTQAIRTKLTDVNAMGLARTVASNLIDREAELDLLMKKVEAIIKVAEQIETNDAKQPSQESGAPEGKTPLRGALSEFSVIDLCQVLVQGNKTGCLIIKEQDFEGQIYFYCGAIVHALLSSGEQGIDALPVLLKLKRGLFEFLFDESSPEVTIEGDAMGILMDACRMADES